MQGHSGLHTCISLVLASAGRRGECVVCAVRCRATWSDGPSNGLSKAPPLTLVQEGVPHWGPAGARGRMMVVDGGPGA